jgi:hypothetical protein
LHRRACGIGLANLPARVFKELSPLVEERERGAFGHLVCHPASPFGLAGREFEKSRRTKSAPRGSYLASPPALRLLGARSALLAGLRRSLSRRPVLVPVGRSVGVDRVRLGRKTPPAADRPPFP